MTSWIALRWTSKRSSLVNIVRHCSKQVQSWKAIKNITVNIHHSVAVDVQNGSANYGFFKTTCWYILMYLSFVRNAIRRSELNLLCSITWGFILEITHSAVLCVRRGSLINAICAVTLWTLMMKNVRRRSTCVTSAALVSSQSLEHHLAVHRDERPFSCSLCDKLFRRKQRLELHMTTHDRELPYICNLCNKQFRCSSSLKYHEKIHKGEKQFSCSRCSLRFRTSQALSGHFTRKHAEVRQFSCRICEKLFGINTDLQKHMKRHSVARVCLICNVQVKGTDCFRKHMLTHGKDEQVNSSNKLGKIPAVGNEWGPHGVLTCVLVEQRLE